MLDGGSLIMVANSLPMKISVPSGPRNGGISPFTLQLSLDNQMLRFYAICFDINWLVYLVEIIDEENSS